MQVSPAARALAAAVAVLATAVLVPPALARARSCAAEPCRADLSTDAAASLRSALAHAAAVPAMIGAPRLDADAPADGLDEADVAAGPFDGFASFAVADAPMDKAALATGSRTLESLTCDARFDCAPAPAAAAFAASAPGVRVTPDGGVVQVYGGATAVPFTFYVRNTGPAPVAYALAASCQDAGTGAPTSGCSASASSVTVNAGDSAAVAVNVYGATVGQFLVARLSAQSTGNPAIADAGWLDVEVRSLPGSTMGAPVVATASANAGVQVERSQCVTVAAGQAGAMECGDLRLVHGLPAIMTRGKARAPTLIYNSDHAHPRPIIYADVTLPAGYAVPAQIQATLVINGVTETRSWGGNHWSAGTTRRVGIQVDGINMATGVHAYTLQVTTLYGSTQYPAGTQTGEIVVVNRKDSPFGPGWWLAGQEQLIATDYRWLVVKGDGSTRLYSWTSPGVWVAPGGSRPDSLLAWGSAEGSYYRRPLPGGSVVWFDPAQRHVATVNRLQDETGFRYNSAGRLDSIQVPRRDGVSSTFRFSYTGTPARVSAVELRSAGTLLQVDTLEYTGGRLTAISDPDRVRTRFVYGDSATPNRVTGRTDRRGYTVTYAYGAPGKVITVFQQITGSVTSITSLDPGEAKGIASPVGPTSAYTRIDGPRGVEVGPDGVSRDVRDHTYIWRNAWGAPTRIRDPLGNETLLWRENATFPALVTRVAAPGGRVSLAAYDAAGRVDSTVVVNPLGNGQNAITRYTYDNRWNAPTSMLSYTIAPGASVRTALAGIDSTAYDSITGNRSWQQQGGATRRVTFGYYPAGHPSAGLIANVRTPLDVAHGVPGDSMYYDAAGNLAWTVSPTGMRTQFINDALGRRWVTVAAVDSARTLFRRDSVVYDAAGRVALSISTGPALSIANSNPALGYTWEMPQERLYVRNEYDAGGLVLAVKRWAVPDTAHVDTLVTRFRYDRAGRKTAEIAADGMRDSTEYDLAGNVIATTTRRGARITMAYDALGRLLTRITPATSTYSRRSVNFAYAATFHFPRWGTDATGNATVDSGTITLPGDTTRFVYDATGNMVYASNRDAIVRRGYNRNGSIAGDTLIIATYLTRDTTQHVYGLRYDYDMAGRRKVLHHPGSLAPSGGWDVSNEYDPVTGALTSVSDPVGTHSFAYNATGQLTGELYPNGVTELYQHDAEGRLWTRKLTIPGGSGSLDDDTLSYDARGKLALVNQRIGEVRNFYSGLGSLAWSRSSDNALDYMEQAYIQDALGNTAMVQKYDYTKVDIPTMHITTHTYQAGTGRLQLQRGGPSLNDAPTSGNDVLFDAAGNTVFSSGSSPYTGPYSPRKYEGTASYYDASDRLRIVDKQACVMTAEVKPIPFFFFIPTGPGHTELHCYAMRSGEGSVQEEYRYDPLGRRVLVRSRENCEIGCHESLVRTVWDGDRVLWEIRGGEQDVIPAGQLPPWNVSTGRVVYTFGSALDHPLAVHRFDYRDSVFTANDTASLVQIPMQPLTVYPHTNWRGDYQIGTFVTGETQRCVQVPAQPGDNETVDGTVPGQTVPAGTGNVIQTYQSCLAAVRWAGKYMWLDHSIRSQPPGSEYLWMGSLVHNKRDLTGNLYMRNRYYDAQAGRFSQEDPIGLAGGLNAYGFANGDPVSYNDPYGLCAWAISAETVLQCTDPEGSRSSVAGSEAGPGIGTVVCLGGAAVTALAARRVVTTERRMRRAEEQMRRQFERQRRFFQILANGGGEAAAIEFEHENSQYFDALRNFKDMQEDHAQAKVELSITSTAAAASCGSALIAPTP